MSDYIGIIGAMDSEVKGLIARIEDCRCERVGGLDFYSGHIGGKSVVVSKCGVGKVFAAMCAEAMIIKYAPRLIINSGVGGALADGLKCTDIVVATRLVQHDMDTSAIGDPVGLISGINKVYFETDARAREILVDAAKTLSVNYYVGTVATGDKFISSLADKSRINSTFGAIACEMEGGAIAHTSFVNGTPFIVVRAISDSADGDASMDYPTFLPIAANISTDLTLALIERY